MLKRLIPFQTNVKTLKVREKIFYSSLAYSKPNSMRNFTRTNLTAYD